MTSRPIGVEAIVGPAISTTGLVDSCTESSLMCHLSELGRPSVSSPATTPLAARTRHCILIEAQAAGYARAVFAPHIRLPRP